TIARRPRRRSICTTRSSARRSEFARRTAFPRRRRAWRSASSGGRSRSSPHTARTPHTGRRSNRSANRRRGAVPETIVTTGALYVRHARAADRGAWSVERDIDWKAIDARIALSQPDILAKLRDAALIESFHPVNLSRLIRLTWDDIDAGVVFSLEMFEGFKHFHALRTYLDVVGYEPAITNDDLRAIRKRAERADLDPADSMTPLVEFML